MGNGSSVTSAIDDFNNVTKSMSSLEDSLKSREKHGFDMIKELGTIISQLENLKIKLNLEERAIKKGDPEDKLKKIQSRSAYVSTALAQLQEWRVEEELNIDRLRRLDDQLTANKMLLSRLDE